MNVFIVGGTGFLGYYTVLELLKRDHQVSTLALPPMPAERLLPDAVHIELADLSKLDDSAVLELLQGSEGLIFAAGVDDRVIPKKPAYPFFYKGNVESTRRLIRLARQAGVKKAVTFSSYFLEFERSLPELELAEVHPYIRSRKEQVEATLEEAGDEMQVSFLLLPYIFGSMPGRAPLWKPLISYLDSALPWIFYPKGGTAMVSVQEVASAAVRALESGEHAMQYPICAENMRWAELLGKFGSILGKPKPIISLPTWLVKIGAWFTELSFHLKGKQGGLDLVPFIDLQTSETYLDPDYSRNLLDYPRADLDQALRDTVAACQTAPIKKV